MTKPLRIGIIGAGGNTRLRHLPGFLAIENVEIVAVCNRRPESTAQVAREFKVPKTYANWEDLLADPDVDAIAIGTWPYLHCPITLAALKAGKHVLTEARLAMNASEAHQMLKASQANPKLVTQVVPSPFGLKANDVIVELIQAGFLGELREAHVTGLNAALADAASPLSWRQDSTLSGYNMLTLGIVHETLMRWLPPPTMVLAQAHAHLGSRIDPESGVRRPVGTPDSVQVLAVLECGSRVSYHFSGATPFGQKMEIAVYGSDGVLIYDLLKDKLRGASRTQGAKPGSADELPEISIPPEKARTWTVEADFVNAIREGTPIQFTNFAAGVAYMEFTEAVARSAETSRRVELPLAEV